MVLRNTYRKKTISPNRSTSHMAKSRYTTSMAVLPVNTVPDVVVQSPPSVATTV